MALASAIDVGGELLTKMVIGSIVGRFSYGPVWLVSGFLYPPAFVVLLLTISRQIPTETSADGAPVSYPNEAKA